MYGNHRSSHAPSNGHFLSGVLFGIAVGAAAGLLLAPQSGSETRGRVVDKASRLRKEAGKRYGEASSAVHDVVKDASSSVRDVVERGRSAWQRGVESFEETRAAHEDDLPRI